MSNRIKMSRTWIEMLNAQLLLIDTQLDKNPVRWKTETFS